MKKNYSIKYFSSKTNRELFVDLFHQFSKSLYQDNEDWLIEDFLNNTLSHLEDNLIEKFEKTIVEFVWKGSTSVTKIVVPNCVI